MLPPKLEQAAGAACVSVVCLFTRLELLVTQPRPPCGPGVEWHDVGWVSSELPGM